jgi:3-oxoacyl-[acyl-carrier-protein] synthase III
VRNGKRPRARLAAIGAHSPQRVVTNDEIARVVDTSDEWIFERTGIRERRFAGPDEASSDLAVVAAERILADAGVPASEIDVLIVPTASPDHLFPATAALVADRIGAESAAAFDLLAGCTGFIYGLAQGVALIESGIAGTVLVLGAETLSRLVDQTDRSTCILFGDADAVTGFLGFELGADGAGGPDLVIPAGGSRMPPLDGPYAPSDACLQMNGREVFRFASRVMVDSSSRLLEALEMSIDEIDLLVAHQANQRIIDHAIVRLGIPEERVFNNVARHGNTSSASIPLALTEARDAGILSPGDLVLMVGFGAGLTWGSTVARYEPA